MVDIAGQARMRHQGLEFRAKDEKISGQIRVIQRLDPQAIASQEHRAPRPIPHGKREHAAKTFHAGLAPCLPRVDDHFSIGMRAKGVASRL